MENVFEHYEENKEDFYKKFTVNSILVQGKHRKPAPLVTILLTTYKRPCLLKQALDSALNQKGFEDYQILVVDNEGEDIGIQTETAKLLTEYKNNEKVIYYRHEKVVDFKFDSAVKLARSKWVCSLHDDDLLAESHLVNMVEVVKNNQDIHYLACKVKNFHNDISDKMQDNMLKAKKGSYEVVKRPAKYTCTGYYAGWHGAFIERKYYINMGGVPSHISGIADLAMVFKFMYKYGIYELETDIPFYFYRKWSGQACNDDKGTRKEILKRLYNFYLYNNRKYHRFTLPFWEGYAQYCVIGMAKSFIRTYGTRVNLKELAEECNMYSQILHDESRKEKFSKLIEWYGKLCKPKVVQKKSAFFV